MEVWISNGLVLECSVIENPNKMATILIELATILFKFPIVLDKIPVILFKNRMPLENQSQSYPHCIFTKISQFFTVDEEGQKLKDLADSRAKELEIHMKENEILKIRQGIFHK